MNRSTLLNDLKNNNFDLLVIGGGATGAGIALDAATRGLKVALVEKDDFSAGTSSRSTKLIHGGVRYLEQAVKKFDRKQLILVRDALRERSLLIKLAPHLSHPIPLVTPIYSWFGVPYFRMGLKMYDWLAGKQNLYPSRFLSAKEAMKNFPMLKGKGLRGGVLYYDGQFDDARMNVSIILTSIEMGATALNHVEVLKLLKSNGKLQGARIEDQESGEEFEIRAKVVVNATGPFVDRIRKMDAPKTQPILRASSGIHIVLDKKFSPPATGLLIPKTEDGRVLFLLPWLGYTLVGTTDNPAKIEDNPKPSETDIQYILRHLERYFNVPVSRKDVLSSWSGLRPLVSDPSRSDTAKLSRDHVINISDTGLITIAGGKWTTYRKMALDTVQQAIVIGSLTPAGPSKTATTPLYGAEGYSPRLAKKLSHEFGLDGNVANHLAKTYGGKATLVARLSQQGYHQRLSPHHPFLEAEVLYAAKHELGQNPIDILARRMRLTFLDVEASKQVLPRVLDLLAHHFDWDEKKVALEEKIFFQYLDHPQVSGFEPSKKKTA